MLKVIKEYNSRAGDVTLMYDGDVYSVLMRRHISGGVSRCRTRSFKFLGHAADQFKDYIDILNNRKPQRVCTARSRKMRCSEKNCPAKLGGAAYWQIFRDTCLHRTR